MPKSSVNFSHIEEADYPIDRRYGHRGQIVCHYDGITEESRVFSGRRR